MKRKYFISLAILFSILVAAELLFANRQSISLCLNGLEEVAPDMSDTETSGSVFVYSDGSVSVRGKGSLTINNIGSEARYITLNTKKYSHIFTFSIEKTDDGCADVLRKVGNYRFMAGGDSIFAISSDGKLHSLKINFDTNSLFTVNSVTINKKPPFCFNIFRFILVFAIGALISATVVFKLYRRTYNPRCGYTVIIPLIFCVFLTAISTVKAVGFDKYPYELPIGEYDAYGQLFDAFQKGRLDLDIPFDADGFAELTNPYDYYERREFLGGHGNVWDRAYFEGKLYCYFGAAPVILVYYPIYLVSGYVPRPGTVALILTLFASCSILFALRSAVKHYKLRPPSHIFALGAVALCASSMIYLLNAHPSMYYNASLSAILFLSLVIALSYSAADAETPIRRCVCLVLAALSAVFTVGSRPTLLLFAVMTAPLYLDMFFSEKRGFSEKLTSILCFGVPLAVGAGVIMWYNAARFGSPFDFGNNYQLTFSDISYNKLTLSKLFPAICHYFLQAPSFTGCFPFIDINTVNLNVYRGYTYIYGSVGALAFPANLGIFGIFALKPDKQKKFTFFSAVAVAVVVAFFDMCMAGVHIRYLADIAFPIAFAAILTLFELCEYADSLGEKPQKHAFAAVTLLLTLSVAVSAALLFANEADNMYYLLPEEFMFFDSLFR